MKIRNMLLGATLLVAPFAAHAQPVSGIYVGAGLGYNYLQQVNVTPGNAGHFAGSSGVAGVGSVGYGFGNGMRVELEGNYRFNHSGLKGGVIHGNTDAQTYGAMVNGLYDFDIGQSWIYPYLGAGVGYEATQLNGATYTGPGGSGTMKTSTKGGFAAQGIVGAGFPIPGAPGLSLTAEYRFMAVVESETFHTTAGDIKIGNQYNHSALVGLRYAFGAAPAAPAPAPAPAAAPAPAPARTYLVFFDWDKADLTARARQIISEAAQASTHVAVTKIEVNGYADRTGTAAYNQKLSLRRADNVAAELVRDGVAKSAIMVQAFGDTHPLVPTGPGVREPQNRRVEIILK